METVETIEQFVTTWRAVRGISPSGVLNESQLIEFAEALRNKVANVSIAPASSNAKFVAYTGTIGDSRAWKIVEKLCADSNGSLFSIGNTEAGKLLNSKAIEKALVFAVGNEEIAEQLLRGKFEAGQRVSQYGVGSVLSLDDQVSLRIADSAVGDVLVVADKIEAGKVFPTTELPALIENPRVTSINGIAREVFLTLKSTLPPEQLESGLQELVRAGALIKGSSQYVTLDDGYRQSVLQRIEKSVGPIEVGKSLRAATSSLTSSAVQALGTLGVVANLITMFSAVYDAQGQAKAGHWDQAALVMTEWGARFGGSMVGGLGAAELVGTAALPLLEFGPLGAAGWSIATALAGIAGGIFGDQVVAALFEPFGSDPTWNLTTTVGLASRNDDVGFAYRLALRELNPLVLLLGPPTNTAGLELFDSANGTGSITRGWIEGRCMMMAAFLEYYGRDDEHDHLLSRSFGLPFGFSGDVVISDAARGLDGNLTIDGFDFGISAPRYLRFGDAGAVPSQLFARCAVAVIT